MDAVRAALLDEVGPAVEEEERPVGVAGAPDMPGRGHDLVVRDVGGPQPDDVDAASERGVEKILAARTRIDREAETRAREPRAALEAVHRGGHYLHVSRRQESVDV
jgi:hypothetical protein